MVRSPRPSSRTLILGLRYLFLFWVSSFRYWELGARLGVLHDSIPFRRFTMLKFKAWNRHSIGAGWRLAWPYWRSALSLSSSLPPVWAPSCNWTMDFSFWLE